MGRGVEVLHGTELQAYRAWALDRYQHLEMMGVNAGDLRFRLEDVYVPLRISARAACLDTSDEGARPLRAGCVEEAGDVELTRAFKVAGADRDVIIFGEPGSGKTTALRKLLHLVLTEGGKAIGLDEETVPLFLRLRALDEAQLERPIAAFIQAELEALAPRGTFSGDFGRQLWQRGRLLLLLDGLDEVASDERRARVVSYLLRELGGALPKKIRCAVSCRYAGYGGQVDLGARFLSLDVRPLDDDQIRGLVTLWFRQARRTQEVYPERFAAADEQGEKLATELVETLSEKQYATQQLRWVVSTPLLLTLLCVVKLRGGEIPRRRTEFYRECLRVLLGRWSEAKGVRPLLQAEDAVALLRPVAFRLHNEQRRDNLSRDEFDEWLSAPLERLVRSRGLELSTEELVVWLHRGTGVLSEYAAGLFGFSHLGLQEYLAAMHIAREGGEFLGQLAGRFGEDWWKEVTLLLVGQPEYSVFRPFVEQVVANGKLVSQQELLRQCLDEADTPEPTPFLKVLSDPEEPPEKKAAVLRLFLDRDEPEIGDHAADFQLSEDADLKALARQLCARAGLPVIDLDEPARVGGPEPFVEPTTDMRFLWVPGGRFEMGDVARPTEVAPFWLAETPVTNRQYGIFLQGAGRREPEYWRDRLYSGADQPVVGVSWHDAVTFCEWLSKVSGRPIAFPTEAQWEFAARGTDGRPYPWGPETPTPEHANFDGKVGRPTPVGGYPLGAGPFGHLDLAGNVWEWCFDEYKPSKLDLQRMGGQHFQTADGRWSILKGGGWDFSAQLLRAASRDAYPAEGRLAVIGFRVAASPASP